MKTLYTVLLLTLVLALDRQVHAQTTINPDIGIIPRFKVTADDAMGGNVSRSWSRPNLAFDELEVVAQAYLNPFAKGTVVFTLPGPDVELNKLGIEEAYATILRGLPLDLNLQVGKYRADFGKFNLQHPHAWPFITQPLSQEQFIGEEGLNDVGIQLSTLLPTGDVPTKLTVDLLRGNSIATAAGIEDTTGASPFYANSARLTSFFELDDENDLELGLSGFTGIHDPYSRDRFYYLNVDFKYRYRPSSYTSVTVQGELLRNSRVAERDAASQPFVDRFGNPERRSIASSGAYFFADFQFLKSFSVGGRIDWSQSPYGTRDEAKAFSLFFGYYPVEETMAARVEYRKMVFNDAQPSVSFVGLQLLFSLGPHKAHQF